MEHTHTLWLSPVAGLRHPVCFVAESQTPVSSSGWHLDPWTPTVCGTIQVPGTRTAYSTHWLIELEVH